MKQRTAVASMIDYVQHVEKSSALLKRLTDFLAHVEALERPDGKSVGTQKPPSTVSRS